MDTAALIARMQEQRSTWVPLPGGQRVRLLRPVESELHRFIAGVNVEDVCRHADGWDGFTEATLLGPAIGASDPLPFNAELWAAYVRDRVDVAKVCVTALAKLISDHLERKDSAAKN